MLHRVCAALDTIVEQDAQKTCLRRRVDLVLSLARW